MPPLYEKLKGLNKVVPWHIIWETVGWLVMIGSIITLTCEELEIIFKHPPYWNVITQ